MAQTWKAWLRLLFGGGEPESVESPPPEEEEEPEPYVVTDFLDLHGFFPEQVREVVDEFLKNARDIGLDEVRIAHGKGRSVLKREVWKVLEGHPLVRQYREAPPERGGWGATLAWINQTGNTG